MWIYNACVHIFTSCEVRLFVRGCEICRCISKEVSLDFGYKDRPVPSRTLGISPYSHASSIHPSLFLRLFESSRDCSAFLCVGLWGGSSGGLTPVLSVTVALWNPTEAQSGLTGSRGLDALPSPSPVALDTQTHTRLRCSTVMWLKLAWKQCRGGRMTSWHPAEEHAPRTWIPFKCTHREEHTRNIYMCTKTLNISSLEITLAVLRRQRSCYVVFYGGLWANGWPGYGHTLTGFGGWDWTC